MHVQFELQITYLHLSLSAKVGCVEPFATYLTGLSLIGGERIGEIGR